MSSSPNYVYQITDVIPPGVSLNHPLGNLNVLINRVRRLVQTTAPTGNSREDSVATVLAGRTSEPLVPIFFRCTWPPGSQTRHKLIWMKPSISDADFGRTVTSNFGIIETGGAVRQMPATFYGCSPFTSGEQQFVDARRRLNCEVDEGRSPTNQQNIKMLAYAMCGFFELLVQPLQERAKCFLCRQPFPLLPANVEQLRVLVTGQALACVECAKKHGPVETQRLGREWNLADMKTLAQ